MKLTDAEVDSIKEINESVEKTYQLVVKMGKTITPFTLTTLWTLLSSKIGASKGIMELIMEQIGE